MRSKDETFHFCGRFKMEKEFEIAGGISEVSDDMCCDEFIDIFIDFIEF